MKVNVSAIIVLAAAGVCLSSATPIRGTQLDSTRTNNPGNQPTGPNIHPFCATFYDIKPSDEAGKDQHRNYVQQLRDIKETLGTGTTNQFIESQDQLDGYYWLFDEFEFAFLGSKYMSKPPRFGPNLENYAMIKWANRIFPVFVSNENALIDTASKYKPSQNSSEKPSDSDLATAYLIGYLNVDTGIPKQSEAKKWMVRCFGPHLGLPITPNSQAAVSSANLPKTYASTDQNNSSVGGSNNSNNFSNPPPLPPREQLPTYQNQQFTNQNQQSTYQNQQPISYNQQPISYNQQPISYNQQNYQQNQWVNRQGQQLTSRYQ
ncbi:hypothetical protein H4R33_006206 [Dimargaris cristalligena]|nr:hypothetical protein H4R33_006206 [Dimargaris cristalligena]